MFFLKKIKDSFYNYSHRETDDLFTDVNEAIEIIYQRRKDIILQKKINTYLVNDIPQHFALEKPIMYLSRHIATPNLETLKFIEVVKPYNLPIVIGEDLKGKFISLNADKRSLGKMQIIKGINRHKDEIIENFSIVDFKVAEGKKFEEITTIKNQSLPEFHHNLFYEFYPDLVKICDESVWIDRNFRNDIFEQYKKFLTLMICGGIMFEVYYPEDREFVEKIVFPAFDFISNKFGVRPLICKIFPDSSIINEIELIRYPSVIYKYVDNYIKA